MILLWGVPEDRPIRRVCEALQANGHDFALVDQHKSNVIGLEIRTGERITGTLTLNSRAIQLSEVAAIYARPYDWQQVCQAHGIMPISEEWRHAMVLDAALHAWWATTPGLTVNPIQSMGPNSSKPYQLEAIRAAGFQVPATLVTTDAADVENFWAEHPSIIYKSVSSVRSHVAQMKPIDRQRLKSVEWCPTQFQQYIPGKDVRVHVVVDELFATEVDSDAVDYRYADRENVAEPTLRAVGLPDEVANRCVTIARDMDLPFAGVDLRVTPAGEWFCFEVNPSPGFSYYESATGQPIAAAVARLLAGASRPTLEPNRTAAGSSSLGHPFVRADQRPSVGPLPTCTS